MAITLLNIILEWKKKMNEKSSPASRLLKRWVVIFLVGGHFSSTQKDVLISP